MFKWSLAIGDVNLVAIIGTTLRVPYFQVNHCKIIKDREPADEIYAWSTFGEFAET